MADRNYLMTTELLSEDEHHIFANTDALLVNPDVRSYDSANENIMDPSEINMEQMNSKEENDMSIFALEDILNNEVAHRKRTENIKDPNEINMKLMNSKEENKLDLYVTALEDIPNNEAVDYKQNSVTIYLDDFPNTNWEKNLQVESQSGGVATNLENIQDDKCVQNDFNVADEDFVENENMNVTTSGRKGRYLINKSLTLPYYEMPKPNFHEYTRKIAVNLGKPIKKGSMQKTGKFEKLKEIIFRKEFYSPRKFRQKFPVRQKQSIFLNANEKESVDNKQFEDIILYDSPSTLNAMPSSDVKTQKENYNLEREVLKKRLKDQMQKKKEAAFDKHKEMQQVDDEICGSDIEDPYSPTSSIEGDGSSPHAKNPNSDGEESDEFQIFRNTEMVSESQMKMLPSGLDVESTLPGTNLGSISSDEESIKEESDVPGRSMDIADLPISLSIPSYQPGGGFMNQSNTFSDSPLYDDVAEIDSTFENESSQHSIASRNFSNLDSSQAPIFASDDVSVICSGQFLGMAEERPWTPSSDSQINNVSDIGCFDDKPGYTDGEAMCDNRERVLSTEHKRMIHNYHHPVLQSSVYQASKRRINEVSIGEPSSPPSKMYKTGLNLIGRNGIPSSNINETLHDISEHDNRETFEDEDFEEQELIPRRYKCRQISDDSDDSNFSGVTDNEADLSVGQQFVQIQEHNSNDCLISNQVKVQTYFDEEAELSGDEMSSDESDGDEADNETEQEQIPDDVPANEEDLKEQVASIYFKHERDDDARRVKRLQQDFLPEGELHADGSGREKTFHWSNNIFNNPRNEILSESEPEDNIDVPVLQDKMKWRQETSVVHLSSDSESSDIDNKEKSQNQNRLPVSIIGRGLLSQNIGTNQNAGISPFPRRHGSLINAAGPSGLNLNVPGSVQRRTVLFQAPARLNKVTSSSSRGPDAESIFTKLPL